MDYSQFMIMHHELGLLVVFLLKLEIWIIHSL